MDRIYDLALCDHLAATDDIDVGGFLLDQPGVLFLTQMFRIQDTGACTDKVRIFLRMKNLCDDGAHHHTDGGRAGQSR